MPLTVGDRLGHYNATAKIGEGGMGQVYQATDTKLNRQVALRKPGRRARCWSVALVMCLSVLLVGCTDSGSDVRVLTADLPLHLEDYLDVATIEGAEVPAGLPESVEWRFDEPQPDWKPVAPLDPATEPVQATRAEDALRLVLSEANRSVFPWGRVLYGAISVDLPDWKREEWAYVLVRARTSGAVGTVGIEFNLREELGSESYEPFEVHGEYVDVINDGSEQSYLMQADWSYDAWNGPWRQLGVEVTAGEPATIDILSISLIPKEANYVDAPAGIRTEARDETYRRTLYTHTPGRFLYRVRVPEAGRLDVGLGVLRDDVPVTFRITAQVDGAQEETLLNDTFADTERWGERSVDLSHLQGQTVTVALAADADRPGTVALWGAPTLSGARTRETPNVIFYIIDGAGADYMSVYGYNRRTTPNLERIAAEGAVFEWAYSNSSWTQPSTASYLTSLHHSVLGGLNRGRNPVPDQALTMAEHLRRAGYSTGMFTTNPNAGRMSNLDRGHDVFREAMVTPTSASSVALHENFWQWRESYPREPYYVHFQTTDVHWPWTPVAPFGGLFISPERRETYYQWERELDATWNPFRVTPQVFEQAGIDRREYFDAARSLYDEGMAHNDDQIGQLVGRLKASGEWEHTLLIVAADHGFGHGLGLLDPVPPRWGPHFSSYVSRIPLIVVWPERIAPGQRFSQPVSMIDMLPTILELAGLPMPDVMQGQSLAPLLLGEEGWEPRPVILDEFYADTGELRGQIEVIDGRWGASLEINPTSEREGIRWGAWRNRRRARPTPLLLYDLWSDPHGLNSLHEERLDLVEKYTAFLEAQFEEHQVLAQRFTRGEELPLTPEQLRALRALGYIR